MIQVDDSQIDNWLRQTAAEFPYPAAPDVRPAVRQRLRPAGSDATTLTRRRVRLAPAWAILTVLLLAASLLLAPQVRAAVFQLLRAGGITIFVAEPTPQLAVTPTVAPAVTATATGTDAPPSFLVPVTPVTLAEAGEAFASPRVLPASLPPFGAPQEVYVDDEGQAQVAILVWSADEGRRYVLYAIAARDFATKRVEELDTTTVAGYEAFWIEGPHGFILHDSEMWDLQPVAGPVLIWLDGDLTYRLEGAASLDEARQLAEALSP